MVKVESKDFKIISIQERSLLVIILSFEITNHYWKELQMALANYNIANADVYFDFLYRNGLKNRFFKSKLDGFTLIINSLKKCDIPQEYKFIADKFFSLNFNWIDSSVLSSFQKLLYKNKLKNNLL